MALFHVVEFLEEAQEGLKGPVAVIPDSWLLPFTDSSSNRFCNWPPKSVKADANFIIKAKKPDSSWHLHQIRLHKSLSNYQAANQICERLKEMSEVESDDTNTPTQRKRPRITPVRFQDAQVTESEGETESEADESRSNDHSVMQEVQPQLPYCLPPVVVSHTMSPTSSYGKSTISPLPSCFPSPGFRPASTVNYNLLGAKLEKMERMLHQVIALIEELKDNSKDMKRRLVRLEHGKEVKRGKLPEGFEFPLKSPDDVERLEFDLKTDGEKKTHLECHLAMLGGTALKHVVKSILSVLFSTELARNYNFNGLKGKRGLKNHPYILQTIQDAARKSFPQATDHDLRVEISTWLAGARDRENGRRERAEFSLYKTLNCCLVEEVVEDK